VNDKIADYIVENKAPSAAELVRMYLQAGFVGTIDEAKMDRAVQSHSNWYVVRHSQGHLKGKLLGVGRFISDHARYACIYDVIVEKDSQNQGIGSAIMQRIIADCTALGIDTVHLWPSKGQKGFYTRLGFASLTAEQPAMTLGKRVALKLE
jgi:N-acetylglutamate synthase-like GNAT family acetyltransferase